MYLGVFGNQYDIFDCFPLVMCTFIGVCVYIYDLALTIYELFLSSFCQMHIMTSLFMKAGQLQ